MMKSKMLSSWEDSVFIQCECGCSIIGITELYDGEYLLEYYGSCRCKQPDFIFATKDDVVKLITFMKRAVAFQFEEQADEYSEIVSGILVGADNDECLSVTADNLGTVEILKYRKNFKKFTKFYTSRSCDFNDILPIIPYDKCKCDWDIVLDEEVAKECIKALEQLLEIEEKE